MCGCGRSTVPGVRSPGSQLCSIKQYTKRTQAKHLPSCLGRVWPSSEHLGSPSPFLTLGFSMWKKKKKIKGFRLDQVRFSSFLTLTHIQKNVLQHMTHRITLRAITQVPGCQCLHKRKVHFSHNCQCEVSGFVGGSPPHSDPGTQPP